MKYIVDIDVFDTLFKVDSIGVFGIGKSLVDSEEDHSWSRIKSIEEFEELNSDYINEHYGDLQDTAYQKGYDAGIIASSFVDKSDEAYQKGLDDAWEAAKKISLMPPDEIEKVFPGAAKYNRYNLGYSGVEAIAKLKAYEEKQDDEIEVGDTVNLKDASLDKENGLVTKIWNNDYCYIVWSDGSGGSWAKNMLVKTGKHIDIASILEEMRHD